jgi:hypothetical protein
MMLETSVLPLNFAKHIVGQDAPWGYRRRVVYLQDNLPPSEMKSL